MRLLSRPACRSRDVRWRRRRGARSGGRRTRARPGCRAGGWRARRGCRGGRRLRRAVRCRPGVAAGEGAPGAAAVGDGARGPVLAPQAGDLRPGEAGHLDQESAEQALVGLPPAGVVEPLQGLGHERVGLVPGLRPQVERSIVGQTLPNLVQGLQALRVESHDHPPMIRNPAPSGSFHVGINPRFRLTAHWTRRAKVCYRFAY